MLVSVVVLFVSDRVSVCIDGVSNLVASSCEGGSQRLVGVCFLMEAGRLEVYV